MNLNFLRRQAIISSQARKRDLPYLCELEYLESTGEQYIDTGFIGTDTTVAELTFSENGSDVGTGVFGTFYNGQRFQVHVTSATMWTIGIGEGYHFIKRDNNKHTAILDVQNKIAYWDGVAVSYTGFTTPEPTKTLLLFATNGAVPRMSKSAIYACKIKDNGILVFDGIPVLDYLLRPAMFDRVSGKFFYNEGSGADFKYGLRGADGNLYTSVPYIESTGGAMIRVDIPITGTQKVKHVCCQQYVTQEGRQLEGFAQAGRWFGTNDGYYHITSNRKSDVMSSTTDFDKIVFESEVGRQSLIVNGAEILTMQTADIQDIAGIRLFAAGGNSYICYLKKKYHLVYLDNKLVFAGVPVVNTNGVAGLFDVITKTMFKNVFTGEFLIGE